MSKYILGLDLGSNSIGWALLKANNAGKPTGPVDLGSHIFNKAVEDKTPKPKNEKRRDSRLARRVVQRRARRRQRMLNYLARLNLLPPNLKESSQPEKVLNELGDPYFLRSKALDSPLGAHELGRVFLHLVQRRGFLSSRRTLLGQEMLDDPDVQEVLAELEEDTADSSADATDEDKEETAFKRDIGQLREKIRKSGCRTLANDEAAQKYAEIRKRSPHLGLSEYSSRDDKLKYRLWKDQGERCAYSGKAISLTTLFSAEIEIDHILLYSRSLDDSYLNKVVCYAAENRAKANRTPADAFDKDDDKWNQIIQAIARWGKPLKSKRERFYKREADLLNRDFIGSQLADTRYISREAGSYLKTLGVEVTFPKAVLTAQLRHQWGLNSLLGDTEKKERADHRHHAIDAAVIACVDRRMHQDLVKLAKAEERSCSELKTRALRIDLPWRDFRLDMHERLVAMIVSHVPQRKITGALHEETGVGFVEGQGTVYRENLDTSFKTDWVDKIVDDVVREQVGAHLENNGNDPKRAFAEGKKVLHKNGKTPIKRVRVWQSKTSELDKLRGTRFGVRDRQGKIFKWMAYGNNHHVEIIRHRDTGKYRSISVTAMEAARRARGINGSKELIVQTDHGKEYEFVMALHINDLVSISENGKKDFYRVQKIGPKIVLRLHTAATIKNKAEGIRKSVSTLMGDYAIQKCSVTAIGKVRHDKTDH